MFNNPFWDFLMTVAGVAVALLLLLYLTGNVHCWNIPLITRGCVIGG